MTSRDRILAGINHEETDRIPVDLGGSNATTILAEAYLNFIKQLRIDKPVRIGDTMQFWELVDEEVMERFHCDAEPCYPLFDNIQSNVRPENIIALYDAAAEYGSY